MTIPALASSGSGVINLDQPGTLLHWSIFTVSVANLVLIAVMVVIFGVALVLPFPKGRTYPAEAELPAGADPGTLAGAPGRRSGADLGEDEDADMWSSRLRRRALSLLPPGKLLPDRQPAYVASWVYVFGVASLAALGVAIVSGVALALGGTDWWHTNPVGHFFNSLHLWSIELFMAFLVIHLWGKFWMAAWRGRRAMTWITGVIAFMASVVECFTGYLSQQNFDSQWISASGKDAFNATGLGAFFNAMNFGQMLLWHVVLVPIVLVAIVGAHILLVRVHGVSHPLPAHLGGPGSPKERRKAQKAADAAPWRGPTRRYDIIKEGTIAGLVVLVLTVALAFILSSPDVPSATVQSWSKTEPADFLATAATELNGTSGTAGYGPPYNNATGATQSLLFAPANILGVTQPINTAQDFVLQPLGKLTATNPPLAAALATYQAAPPAQQMAWVNAYLKAVTHVKFTGGTPVVPAAADGPVPAMLATEYTMARSGALDTDLLAQRDFYGTNFTKPLLFMGDGAYFSDKATAMHLTGEQWPSGCHERNRQLPRPALALAVHPVVLRPRLLRLRQHRPHRGLPDRPGHHLAAGPALHPRPARHPTLDPSPPPHLAPMGTSPGRRGGQSHQPCRGRPPR
jgi:Cytochrome b(N-terminal)/b6/petB